MIKIKEEEKVKIIQDLLNQRYQAEHMMRERSQDFTKWILGFGIGLLWIILSNNPIFLIQKIILSIFIFILLLLTCYYLVEINKGFKNNRGIIIKLEELLGFYKVNYYLENDSIFPEKYHRKTFSHFKSLFIFIIVTAITLILLIFTNPINQNDKNDDQFNINQINNSK